MIRKKTAVLLTAVLLMMSTGCSKKQEPSTVYVTEATTEQDTLMDQEGFSPVKGYVESISNKTNVYMEPRDDSDIYITVDSGVNFARTGVGDGWTRILLNGGNYYMKSSEVRETDINWVQQTDPDKKSHIVFIDPSKQVIEDSELELMSPDLDPENLSDGEGMKPKMGPAAVGVETGAYEYDVTMELASKLNAELVTRGYTVFMSRNSGSVSLSNSKRALMANANNAEVFIRLETGSVSDESVNGALGFITTSTNSVASTRYQQNYELCYDILKHVSEDAEAKRLGIYETDDMTCLNFCEMPATAINVGFLSNKYDDVKLSDEDYQKKLAAAIADGIDAYFSH